MPKITILPHRQVFFDHGGVAKNLVEQISERLYEEEMKKAKRA